MQFGESITAPEPALVARRFYRITEAAVANGMPPATAYCRIAAGKLPVVEIPSPEPNPTRRIIRVPSSWLPFWIELREPPEDEASWPSRDGEPFFLSVPQAAEALSVSTFTVYGLIRTGQLRPAVACTDESFGTRLSRARLDLWCRDLVLQADSAWSGVEPFSRAVAR